MKGVNWSLVAVLVVFLCHLSLAAPSVRVKRQDELTLDPVSVEVNYNGPHTIVKCQKDSEISSAKKNVK